jgi:hypothetical protein
VEDPAAGLPASDEDRHEPGADVSAGSDGPWWQESWVFEAAVPDGSVGLTTALTFRPRSRRSCYWVVLVRAGAPNVHVAELDLALPVAGLRVRSPGLWADHVCEAPFEQWTVANEVHAVGLDDPDDAVGRAYGEPVPMAFDLEWYAAAPPVAMHASGVDGYAQTGEVDGVIELPGGALRIVAPSRRRHWWGTAPWWPEDPARGPVPAGRRAPVVLDGEAGRWVLERVLTPAGWWEERRPG